MYNIMERVPEFKEEWRRVSDYIPIIKDQYLISNKGKVFSEYTNGIMSMRKSKKGYLELNLSLKDQSNGKRSIYMSVHRVMMLCFNPIPNPEKYQVNHTIGIKDLNEIPLLEWCTNRENMNHAMKHNLVPKGETKWNATITDQQAHQICFYLQFGFPFKYISHIVLNKNLDKSASDIISSIRNKRHFKHISSQYKIDNSRHALHAFSDEQAVVIFNCCKSGMDNKSILNYINYNVDSLPQDVIEKLYFDIDCIRIKDRYKNVLKNL